WPDLSRLDVAGLVKQLESPNGWLLDTAQQLIVQRRDRSQGALLERIVTEGKTSLGRRHALYTLSGLNALKPSAILHALRDPNGGVRRHAVRLAESSLLRTPEVETTLAQLVADRDPLV